MPTVRDELQQEIDRQIELEDREFAVSQQEAKRLHELRVLKKKLHYTTRWRSVVRIVGQVAAILPKCILVITMGVLLLCKREIPSAWNEFLNS